MLSSVSYFVGLDVHRQTVSYCVKQADGKIVSEGKIAARRDALSEWATSLNAPWYGGLEATICSHWIYQHLRPYAVDLKMGPPAKLKAITAGKRKTDRLDARTLADLLRCELFPTCYVIPPEYELLRRQLRFRSLIVRTRVLFQNKTAGLLSKAVCRMTRRDCTARNTLPSCWNPAMKDLLQNSNGCWRSTAPRLLSSSALIEKSYRFYWHIHYCSNAPELGQLKCHPDDLDWVR